MISRLINAMHAHLQRLILIDFRNRTNVRTFNVNSVHILKLHMRRLDTQINNKSVLINVYTIHTITC